MKILFKLLIPYLILVALLLLLFVGGNTISSTIIEEKFNEFEKIRIESSYASDLGTAIDHKIILLTEFVVRNDPDLIKEIDRQEESFQNTLKKLEESDVDNPIYDYVKSRNDLLNGLSERLIKDVELELAVINLVSVRNVAADAEDVLEKLIVDKQEQVRIGQQELEQSTIQISRVLSSISIVIIILSVLVGLFLSRSISNPIKKLHEGAEIIGKGNLDYRTNIRTKDEIGQLSRAFDQMATKLKESQALLRLYSINLEKEVKKRTKQLDVKLEESEKSKLATMNIMEDITEAKEKLKKSYEELEGLDKLKSLFLTITSHELKTPITPIIIQTQMLLEESLGKLSDKQKDSTKIILRNIERLNQLIGDILEVSKIQSKELKLAPKETQMANCIKETLESMEPVASQKKIRLTTKIAMLPKSTFDPGRISQVLSNLINNAIKFTPEKGKITIEAAKHKEGIMVKVKDTGTGIAEKNLNKIFEPFFQAQPAYTRKHIGTGLGLSICKGIIEQHGGKIWVESKLGEGSTFYFTLPLKAVKQPKVEKTKIKPKS